MPADAAIEAFFHDCPPDVARRAAGRLRRQTWSLLDEVTPLEAWPDTDAVCIVRRADRVLDLTWGRRVSEERFGRPAGELDGGHSPFLSRPAELAGLLVRLAADAGRR